MELSPFPGDDEQSEEPASAPGAAAAPPPDDAAIRALVRRLARANATGGAVIERAAIMAEGAKLEAVLGWIEAHDGHPEERPAPKPSGRGLHAARLSASATVDRPPLRYVVPVEALADPE